VDRFFKTGERVASYRETMVLEDETGTKWLYKPRRESEIFLAEVEQEAHFLARQWGFSTAYSEIIEYDGRKGHAQHMFDGETAYFGDMSCYSDDQLFDIASEHLLDWAIDNDDTWSENMLLRKSGQFVGIDKGRAFVSFGHWKGLTGTNESHVNVPLVYTDLYRAIGTTINRRRALKLAQNVVAMAEHMENSSDADMFDSLERAFKNRTVWFGTGAQSRQEAISKALERKNNLVQDMYTLWSNVFERAGITEKV
jgi:hypothetical protein